MSTWAATAGVRWRLIRHHSAAAAWSSGSGPPVGGGGAQELRGVEAGAGDRGEPVGQQRGEVVLRIRSGPTGSSSWPHSCRAGGGRRPAAVEVPLPGRAAFCS